MKVNEIKKGMYFWRSYSHSSNKDSNKVYCYCYEIEDGVHLRMVAFDANRHSIQEERDHINLSPNPEWYNGAFLSKEEGEAVFAVAKEKLTEFLKSSETEFKKIKTKQEQELNEFEEKQEQELNELKTKQEQKLKDPKERINMFQKDLTLISKALSK